MESYKINENITLHYIPMTKLKTTSVGIYIGRELNKEECSYNAVLPYVLMKGCKMAENASEIAKSLQNLYGAKFYTGINKRGDNQFLNFEGEVISDRFAPNREKLLNGLINLMLSVLFEPVTEEDGFLPDVTEREKINCMNKIKSLINDKTGYANIRCQEEMFKDEQFSVSEYGYIEEIEKITAKSLYKHYKDIIGRSVINIFVCGELNIHEVREEIEKKISGIAFKAASLKKPEILKKSSAKVDVRENTELTQGKLAIGFRTNISCYDNDLWALLVANNIYGGGLGSKLFNNVREKLSLAYYIATVVDRYKGFMLLYAGIAFEKLEEAENEIFFQLNEMKNGNVTDDEMENAKSEIINSLNSCYDNQKLLQSYYMGNIISGVDLSLEDYKENIKRVTKQEVIDVINKLEPDTVYFLERGDAE